MGDSSSPPPTPDPKATAAAQTASNKETAIANANLNRFDQSSPFGSVNYKIVGTNSDGTPKYEQSTSFSPQTQGLFNNYVDMTQGMGDMGKSQLSQLQQQYSTPFSLDASTGKQMADMQHQFMDPVWRDREAAADNRLVQRGFSVGDEGYSRGMRDFADQRDRAYLSADIGARQQGVNEAVQQRSIPMNEFNAMRTGSQVGMPQQSPVPGVSMANTDVAGITQNAYNQQMAAYNAQQAQSNAMMGGLFGLGSAVIGAMPWSDRRLKTDIVRVGSLPSGLPTYEWTYVWGGPRYQGVMADEAREMFPDAVHEIGGFLAVDYGKVR